ncbi:autophagy-related protein 18g [Andrographis paniculata]|uniref:autophagy-related protein 18g n=1 Tax=Andrographis paniculata TaxID=175694 RepID=UPI0021E8E790|nr:autophagy-related protein 18g [Andrographis paniculata]
MKKGKGKNSKLLPNSFRIISSCIKTVSTNASTAVRSAGATVAASISSPGDDRKEQVLWAGFDKLELTTTSFRHVLLLGYVKGFQVFDVEDATSVSELVSRRDGPVTFLQMLPAPAKCDDLGSYRSSHPMLVVVGGNEDERITSLQNNGQGSGRNGSLESSFAGSCDPPTAVRFYSMKLNEYVKAIDFKSSIFMVRCSPRVVAVGLEEQIYCFDALTLEKKFIVITYPVPRVGEHGMYGMNSGYGPMAVGPRWLAYSPNRPFFLNTGRVSPKSLASSVSPSTSPGSGAMMARYAVESSKHLAAGLITLGDKGYKKLSKYYPELLPESPSSPGWISGKLAVSEPENAGMIAVKDLVCSEVISQFRAHTSPISALCFDPSGTLLVTASVHGNNINIFRIMPFHKCGGSGSGNWSTSYAHLYKLHRGITNAVIQDICFSPFSQWIAIVSSRGTCHIFILSPFGGDDLFQILHVNGQRPSLFLASTLPWWSSASFTLKDHHVLPPPPCTLSVTTRIKCSDSGLINSVSNAASSMVGKVWVPSGAVAAIFHNTNTSSTLDVKSVDNSMGHILVYTPSGFVVQHEIVYSMGHDLSASGTELLSTPQVNPPQNNEFRVKVEPIQWWDVCRRLDSMEREECLTDSFFAGPNDLEIDDDCSKTISQENVVSAEKKVIKNGPLKTPERSQWYLSNAEVQIKSCRLPIWQRPKIHFHLMEPPGAEFNLDGEYEIEATSSHEIEIRQKDLLPIFDNFPRARSGWNDRSVPSDGRVFNACSNSFHAKEKTNEASIMCHSKLPSFSSTESSDGGSSRRMENLIDLEHMSIDKCPTLICHPASNVITERNVDTAIKVSMTDHKSSPVIPFPPTNTNASNLVVENGTLSRSYSPGSEILPSLDADGTGSNPDILRPSSDGDTVNFAQLFKEGYCNEPLFPDHHESTGGGTDEMDGGGDMPEEEKPEEEGWMGGMFDFSEEG